ncbi:MAG: aminotransferase class I/II-fold pyridoxal phosphate-dependent enzyme [Xanthomonadales bacterium]|nr:aminotransferase class I/II-fold pyridoxal phosphate-dependent enzyme [Gammaproteobacteria bacterium]MBT8050304.1 aminotransferase class I/II-fold pyridoxal phosphate-dependent enzyme [Gammaproteobacteria bacterium]MBT8055807.1 aminotransferase class I/II-fold pyridoxal phosphate-dependent enzyme [Gammaproteobacteria bacterium]NNJ79783.1 aminotransferase class I/II-fold pyridoxal phosphate-dependent enzyme [Xanthomonadales bacterium]NNL04211.1 aminotransferase class I/II-fold pyridoxal phosp
MNKKPIRTNSILEDVRYEIRGELAHRAHEMERQGYEIISLNIGNPGLFGYRTPETMRLAMIENLGQSEAYCHQKGIFPAREAVVMQQQDRGVMDVSADHVFMGNGVSECIDLVLRALLNSGDEILLPSPDYPLWSASVSLNHGTPVYYGCRPDRGFLPDPDEIQALVTPRTRGIVLINPNNPTGAVYPRELLAALVAIAEENQLIVFADEIYDQMLFDGVEHVPLATLVHDTLCATFNGLSKIYRACGYRVGWVSFNGDREHAADYLHAVELLASLRLCANVPGQWAVQTALGGHQSIAQLTAPGGRLYQSRQAIIDGVEASDFLELQRPEGAMYAFPKVNADHFPDFDDQAFALELLEKQHVLIAPGSSFNVPYRDHFRLTTLPDNRTIAAVFERMEHVLESFTA